MLILYSLKPISEIENSFDKHVEECSKVRVFNIFFSKGLSRERYFGERKKNRFWLSFTAPNQIISGTLRVMNGEIIEYDDFTTIKLKYKIPNSLKIKIAVSYTVLFFVLFVQSEPFKHYRHVVKLFLVDVRAFSELVCRAPELSSCQTAEPTVDLTERHQPFMPHEYRVTYLHHIVRGEDPRLQILERAAAAYALDGNLIVKRTVHAAVQNIALESTCQLVVCFSRKPYAAEPCYRIVKFFSFTFRTHSAHFGFVVLRFL